MGERDHFISLEMAAVGMEMMAGWGNEPIVARLSMLTDRLADGLANSGVRVIDKKLRAPHVLSLQFPQGMAPDLPKKLAAENVYAAPRLGRLRISPHVYNHEEDVERFVETFKRVARCAARRARVLPGAQRVALRTTRRTLLAPV